MDKMGKICIEKQEKRNRNKSFNLIRINSISIATIRMKTELEK